MDFNIQFGYGPLRFWNRGWFWALMTFLLIVVTVAVFV